jgi:hypothetical protein
MEYYKNYSVLKNNQLGGHIVKQEKTYIDFITKSSNDTIRININDDNYIYKLLNKYLEKLDKIICLDFHGITDLYNINEKIPSDITKCVISYIGGLNCWLINYYFSILNIIYLNIYLNK